MSDGRKPDNTFDLKNTFALPHGRRERRSLLEVKQADLYHRWLSDLGGAEQITASQEAVLVRAVEADLLATTAMSYLQSISGRQSLTSEQSQKAIATFMAATDRVFRSASILGLGQVAQRVPEIAKWAASKQNA
jgi:hypothetical protein